MLDHRLRLIDVEKAVAVDVIYMNEQGNELTRTQRVSGDDEDVTRDEAQSCDDGEVTHGRRAVYQHIW